MGLKKFWLCIIQHRACVLVHCKHKTSYPASRTVSVQVTLTAKTYTICFTSMGAGIYKLADTEDTFGTVIKYAYIFMNTSHFSTDHTTWTFTKICKSSWKLHGWQWTLNETLCITSWYVTSRPSVILSHCQVLQYLASKFWTTLCRKLYCDLTGCKDNIQYQSYKLVIG